MAAFVDLRPVTSEKCAAPQVGYQGKVDFTKLLRSPSPRRSPRRSAVTRTADDKWEEYCSLKYGALPCDALRMQTVVTSPMQAEGAAPSAALKTRPTSSAP